MKIRFLFLVILFASALSFAQCNTGAGEVVVAQVMDATKPQPTSTNLACYNSSTQQFRLLNSTHPVIVNCGATLTCAGTLATKAFLATGIATLTAGSATVNITSAGFTAAPRCFANDALGVLSSANATSATSLTLTGTLTHTVQWICVGP
jgi:hypothetical protein